MIDIRRRNLKTFSGPGIRAPRPTKARPPRNASTEIAASRSPLSDLPRRVTRSESADEGWILTEPNRSAQAADRVLPENAPRAQQRACPPPRSLPGPSTGFRVPTGPELVPRATKRQHQTQSYPTSLCHGADLHTQPPRSRLETHCGGFGSALTRSTC